MTTKPDEGYEFSYADLGGLDQTRNGDKMLVMLRPVLEQEEESMSGYYALFLGYKSLSEKGRKQLGQARRDAKMRQALRQEFTRSLHDWAELIKTSRGSADKVPTHLTLQELTLLRRHGMEFNLSDSVAMIEIGKDFGRHELADFPDFRALLLVKAKNQWTSYSINREKQENRLIVTHYASSAQNPVDDHEGGLKIWSVIAEHIW